MKTCNQCKASKSPELFFKDKNAVDGRYSICKQCKKENTYKWREENKDKYNEGARKWRKLNPDKLYGSEIKRRYGCSSSEYERRLLEQDYKCKICLKPHDNTNKRKRLFVDHCHKSSKIRGLLCSACNSAIGYFEDNEERMLRAIEYLKP